MDQSVTLLRSLLLAVHVLAVQTSYTALANAQGKIDARLGDRQLPTHEVLASMLGTRRS